MAKYVCTVCGYEYDEAVGDPDNGIAPGTKWEDIPDDFTCPLCGVGKEDFEKQDRSRTPPPSYARPPLFSAAFRGDFPAPARGGIVKNR